MRIKNEYEDDSSIAHDLAAKGHLEAVKANEEAAKIHRCDRSGPASERADDATERAEQGSDDTKLRIIKAAVSNANGAAEYHDNMMKYHQRLAELHVCVSKHKRAANAHRDADTKYEAVRLTQKLLDENPDDHGTEAAVKAVEVLVNSAFEAYEEAVKWSKHALATDISDHSAGISSMLAYGYASTNHVNICMAHEQCVEEYEKELTD